MPALIVSIGACIVPRFESLPLLATKIALATVPSMPSQLRSVNASSGLSPLPMKVQAYSQPFEGLASRSKKPGRQPVKLQAPPPHDVVEFGNVLSQSFAQPPQWSLLFWRLTSQ